MCVCVCVRATEAGKRVENDEEKSECVLACICLWRIRAYCVAYHSIFPKMAAITRANLGISFNFLDLLFSLRFFALRHPHMRAHHLAVVSRKMPSPTVNLNTNE